MDSDGLGFKTVWANVRRPLKSSPLERLSKILLKSQHSQATRCKIFRTSIHPTSTQFKLCIQCLTQIGYWVELLKPLLATFQDPSPLFCSFSDDLIALKDIEDGRVIIKPIGRILCLIQSYTLVWSMIYQHTS